MFLAWLTFSPVFGAALSWKPWSVEVPGAPVAIVATDFDGDGRPDLLVTQPRGMGGGDLQISAWRGLGAARFVAVGQHQVIPGDASWSHYGEDLTGDGRPDLLVRNGGRLALYPGRDADRRNMEPLAQRPLWSLRLPDPPELAEAFGSGADAGSRTPADGERQRASDGEGSGSGRERAPADDSDEASEEDGTGEGGGPSWSAFGVALVDLDGDDRPEILLWRHHPAGVTDLLLLLAGRP